MRYALLLLGLLSELLWTSVCWADDLALVDELDVSGSMALTSTLAAPISDPRVSQTIQPRLFQKAGHGFVRVGGTYLAREDFWISPGINVEVGFYPLEFLGIEVSSSIYLSTLEDEASQIRRQSGLLPSAEQPIFRIAVGPRWAFAYGKFLGPSGDVVHFDLGLLVRLGGLLGDRSLNAGLDAAVSAQVRLTQLWIAYAEVGAWLSYEGALSTEFLLGPTATLGAGLRW